MGAAESGGPPRWPKAAPPSGRGEGSEDAAGTPTPMRPLFDNVYNEDDDEEEEERDALAFSK